MPLNIKSKWKPFSEPDVLDKVERLQQGGNFAKHVQRMRYEENPLFYQETVTCRSGHSNGTENHLIRFPDISAEFIFRLEKKESLDKDDLLQNPELLGGIHFIKCLVDGE